MSRSSLKQPPDLGDPQAARSRGTSSQLQVPSLSGTAEPFSIGQTASLPQATAERGQEAVARPRGERDVERRAMLQDSSSLCEPLAFGTDCGADLAPASSMQYSHALSVPDSRHIAQHPKGQIGDARSTRRIDGFDLALEVAKMEVSRLAPLTDAALRRQENDQRRREKERQRSRLRRERKRLKQSETLILQGATLDSLGESGPATTVSAAASDCGPSTTGPQRLDLSWLRAAMAQAPGTISLGGHRMPPEPNLEGPNNSTTWPFAGRWSDSPQLNNTIPAAGIADFRPPGNLHWPSLNQSYDVGVFPELRAPLQDSEPQAASFAQFTFANAATNTPLTQPWSENPWAIAPGDPLIPFGTGVLRTSWNHEHVPVPVNADPRPPANGNPDISSLYVRDTTGKAQATSMPSFGATAEANEYAQYLALTPKERANVRSRRYRARQRANKLAQQREQYKDKDQFDVSRLVDCPPSCTSRTMAPCAFSRTRRLM